MTKSKGIRPHFPRWAPERDAQLRELVATRPPLGSTRIGQIMGLTRNQVIGRAHRLKLDFGLPASWKASAASTARVAGEARQRAKARRTTKVSNPNGFNGTLAPRPAKPLPPELPFANPKPAADLERHHCRYIGHRPETITIDTAIYCGARVREGSSYCPEHHALCWAPIRPRRAQDFTFRALR